MSTTEPRTGSTASAAPTVSDVRSRDVERRPRMTTSRETKPSVMTSELWLALAGVVLLVITYLAADDSSLNLFRTCLLATILGAAYVLSRGLAKSGSRDRHDDIDARYLR
jgi:hypothetical protein